ncbi:MAG TPA: ATP-binding protein [Casimicrobiaceae bacterium]|nr:ATP-binding protein [Casimicrobiaceae bacterium]
MSATLRKGTKPRGSRDVAAARGARAPRSGPRPHVRRKPANEAEATLAAIRAGQVDALVIQNEQSERIYALKTFDEIEQTQAALEHAGVERRRTRAQLQALAEERERLFQDMHDGCIQSIYAVGLNLEACMGIMEANPKKAAEMVADATASLSLVIQELRSFITGHKLQIARGEDLRSQIQKIVQGAGNRISFAVDIDEGAMKALTSEQALHMLQIAREAISNAIRHAKARSVGVSLQRRRGVVCLEVSDDGCGFLLKSVNRRGLGLHHIDARARKIGATAQVSSVPNQGTRIVVKLGKTR